MTRKRLFYQATCFFKGVIGMSIKQKIVDHGFAASLAEMDKLGRMYTKVGLPAECQVGPQSKGSDSPPVTEMSQLVKIAAAHEFGATISHPGGTIYRTMAAGGTVRSIFVSNKEAKPFDRRTAPHQITIPERPFMRQTFDTSIEPLQAFKRVRIIAVARGKETAETAIAKIGEWMTARTKKTVRDGNFRPLRPATIAKKQSSRPLIDTSQMINSLQHIEEYRK